MPNIDAIFQLLTMYGRMGAAIHTIELHFFMLLGQQQLQS